MLKLLIGIFVVLGTAGMLDFYPETPIWPAAATAAIGVILIIWGFHDAKKEK